MVGIIHQGASINGMLHYNEQKISANVAQCIGQGNFPVSHHRLSYAMKLNMLQRIVDLRPRKKPAVHISLSFSPEDTLDTKKMVRIAKTYMQDIGFGNQPYLIYRHFDTAHPHMHICTVEVTHKGAILSPYKARRFLSKKVIENLEMKFGLIPVKDARVQQAEPRKARRVVYGNQPVARSIENVLAKVLPHYRYTNLAELNAVLKLYNITANRGLPGSWLYKNRGLYYQVLTSDGKPISKPVKSSYLHGKPTLSVLERNFFINHRLREKGKQHLLKNLHKTLFLVPVNLTEFRDKLALKGVDTLIQEDDKKKKHLIYIDHVNGCVFPESDLGAKFTSQELQQRWKISKKNDHHVLPQQRVAEIPTKYRTALKVEEEPEEKEKSPVRYSQTNQGTLGFRYAPAINL